jgi:putative DNA primase/helicase
VIDLSLIRATMHQRSFSESEIGEVNLAKAFIDDVARVTGVPPISTRGALHLYDDESGTWREVKREEALSLIQSYDGVAVGYVKRLKDGTEEDYTKPLRLSSGKCKGIFECMLASKDALDLAFFDQATSGVALNNGFATVTRAGVVIQPKSHENRATTHQPFGYDGDAPFGEWKTVLGRVFEGDADAADKRLMLQEFVGACLVGIAADYATCLVLVGEGANGKSVVAETIAELLFPAEAVTYTTPQSWSGRFTLSRLRNSRLNVATELPDAELTSSDVFKAVVDGGRLEVEDKNKDPYTMRPRAGHIFLANGLPHTRDNSRGFWRRFVVLEFNRDFTGDPQRETKEAVKARLAKEAPGIMVWALHGAVRLLRNGKYTIPQSHYKAVRDWRIASDQVSAFVEECCVVNEALETPAREVFEAFREWCGRAGRIAVNNIAFGKRLKGAGVSIRPTRAGAVYGVEVLPRADWAVGKVRDVMDVRETPTTSHSQKQRTFSMASGGA